MIRFIDLRGQILDDGPGTVDQPHFAFFDTVIDRFVSFAGEQEWDSLADFQECFQGCEDIELANRCKNLIPSNYFDAITNMPAAQAIQLMRNEVFEDRHRAIGIDITIHNSNIEIVFSAYDGRDHYYGASLAGAVESCLVSNGVFSGSQDEVDRVIRESMQYQERL